MEQCDWFSCFRGDLCGLSGARKRGPPLAPRGCQHLLWSWVLCTMGPGVSQDAGSEIGTQLGSNPNSTVAPLLVLYVGPLGPSSYGAWHTADGLVEEAVPCVLPLGSPLWMVPCWAAAGQKLLEAQARGSFPAVLLSHKFLSPGWSGTSKRTETVSALLPLNP